ncbi:MAG: hypothetical protein ACE5OZ_11505 [Candidatus Heimdallarchaeota archaeon]
MSHQGIDVIKDCDGTKAVTNGVSSFFILAGHKDFNWRIPITMPFEASLDDLVYCETLTTEAKVREYYGEDENRWPISQALRNGKVILAGGATNDNHGDWFALTCQICYNGFGDLNHLARQGIDVIEDSMGF